MTKEEKELQSVTDLVAFQVMAKIFLQKERESEEVEEEFAASHQSDSFEDEVAGHQSDSDVPENRWGLTVPLAWKLARLWQQYRRLLRF